MVRRLIRHFLYPNFRIHFELDEAKKKEILEAIRAAEANHKGEIVVSIEGSLPIWGILTGRTAHERANRIFLEKRVWDTECNTGILIYLVLSERALELVVDRGVSSFLSKTVMEGLCRDFAATAKRNWLLALKELLEKVHVLCFSNLPISSAVQDKNELPEFIESR